jgi:hypothetical protein
MDASLNRCFAGYRLALVPDVLGLRFQAVHADDVGEAYRRAIVGAVDGAFNIAAAPTIDPPELASLLRPRQVPVRLPEDRRLAGQALVGARSQREFALSVRNQGFEGNRTCDVPADP